MLEKQSKGSVKKERKNRRVKEGSEEQTGEKKRRKRTVKERKKEWRQNGINERNEGWKRERKQKERKKDNCEIKKESTLKGILTYCSANCTKKRILLKTCLILLESCIKIPIMSLIIWSLIIFSSIRLVLDNLNVRFYQCWNFGEWIVPLHCDRSEVLSGTE